MPKHDSVSLGEYDTDSGEEDYARDDRDNLEDEIDALERRRDGLAPNAKNGDDATKDEDNKNGKAGEEAEKKPRRVLGPRAKLDPERLCGRAGLPALLKDFENIKWHPKGYEKENLQILMRKMEEWAHSMWPKSRFDDTLEKINHLGSKAKVKNCLRRLTLGLPILPEDFVSGEAGETPTDAAANLATIDNAADPSQPMVFGLAPSTSAPPRQTAPNTRSRDSLSPESMIVVEHDVNTNPEAKGRGAKKMKPGSGNGVSVPLIALGARNVAPKIARPIRSFLPDDDFFDVEESTDNNQDFEIPDFALPVQLTKPLEPAPVSNMDDADMDMINFDEIDALINSD